MGKQIFILLFVLWIIPSISPCAMAQETDNISLPEHLVQISSWRKSNGLPTWHIRDIISDDRGLVWMATDLGLVLMDGKKFTQPKLDGLGNISSNLFRIALDGRKNIWLFFRTADTTAIYVYDPIQDLTVSAHAYTGKRLRFSPAIIKTLYTDKGKIWLLDPKTGLGGYYDPKGYWVDALQDTMPRTWATAYFSAGAGNFWRVDMVKDQTLSLINAQGTVLQYSDLKPLNVFNFQAGRDGMFYLLASNAKAPLVPPDIFQCSPSGQLVLLPTDVRSRLRWDEGLPTGTHSSLYRNSNSSGIEVVMNKLELNVYENGRLLIKNLENYLKTKHRINIENYLFTLADGSFWLVAPEALVRIEIHPNYFTNYFTNFTSPPSTRGMVVYGSRLLVNSYQGFYTINLRTKTSKLNPKIKEGLALAMQNGQIWSGLHGDSMQRTDARNWQSQRSGLEGNNLNAALGRFYCAPDGAFYVGTKRGIYRLDNDKQKFKLWSLFGLEVHYIHHNAAGFWVGTTNGIVLLDELGKPKQTFKALHFPCVKYIHEDDAGIFWLATEKGLWRWRPNTGQVDIYDAMTYGMPSDMIHAVYEDRQERLWLPSNNGLICFNKKSRYFRTFTEQDGLPSNEMNWLSSCQAATGRLYIGGIAGVYSFHPDSIPTTFNNSVRIELLSLKLHDGKNNQTLIRPAEVLNHSNPLIISANIRRASIEFSVPVFSGQTTSYRWRIVQLDTIWNTLSDPQIDLYYLPFGHFTLDIEAFYTGSQQASTAKMQMKFYGQKPIYLQNWFLALTLLLGIVLVTALFRLRQHQLLQMSRSLAAEVAEKTAQLRQDKEIITRQADSLQRLDEQKTRFFQDFSHEIRNPLTLIISPVNDMLKRGSLPISHVKSLERVKRNAWKINNLIEEVLEISKLEAGMIPTNVNAVPILAFLTRTCQDYQDWAQYNGIHLQLMADLPETLTIQTDLRKLEKIWANLIQNALKYTTRGGSIVVTAKLDPKGAFQMEVQDTGIGIAAEDLDRIFDRFYQVHTSAHSNSSGGFGIGLAICRQYARLQGGEMVAISTLGIGTTMRLTLPFKEANEKDHIQAAE